MIDVIASMNTNECEWKMLIKMETSNIEKKNLIDTYLELFIIH